MQIQSVTPTFCGSKPKHAADNIKQVMTKLYDAAYHNVSYPPNIIQVSSKMKNGVEVTGVATFNRGKCVDLSFPYEHARYKNEFCTNILQKFNNVITKGKAYK